MKFSSEPPTAALFVEGKSRRRDWNFRSRLTISIEIETFDRDWIFLIVGPSGNPCPSGPRRGQVPRKIMAILRLIEKLPVWTSLPLVHIIECFRGRHKGGSNFASFLRFSQPLLHALKDRLTILSQSRAGARSSGISERRGLVHLQWEFLALGPSSVQFPEGPKIKKFEMSSEIEDFEREWNFRASHPPRPKFLWGNRDVEIEIFERD